MELDHIGYQWHGRGPYWTSSVRALFPCFSTGTPAMYIYSKFFAQTFFSFTYHKKGTKDNNMATYSSFTKQCVLQLDLMNLWVDSGVPYGLWLGRVNPSYAQTKNLCTIYYNLHNAHVHTYGK